MDLSPKPNVLDEELRKLTTFHDPGTKNRNLLSCRSRQKGGKRVVYKIVEYDPLLDSSNMKYDDYAKIDQDIRELQDIEVIQGSDMTVEAALMKLSYVLGRNDFTAEQKREMMGKDLCGEMTPYPNLYNAGCLDEGEIYNRHNLI
ncbi:hypothetical protein CAPTEDRAFT_229109 [Capitella teleta]|uniref:asparaginase n=1 Tax=Capitella teleta TaxID=283909 RepID=R7UH71_CAPTE|nr:hypothetical protein CAPTEDRAFT_229109 [Capitella teleta]|eukprot:ELU02617.1 hypothetical protein CAPTEDRAFT_229109 [Capitella teleta]